MPKKRKQTPNEWINQTFSSIQATNGGIVRRKIDSVGRFAGHENFENFVKHKQWHMVISGDQYIVFCNNEGQFKVVC